MAGTDRLAADLGSVNAYDQQAITTLHPPGALSDVPEKGTISTWDAGEGASIPH